MKLGISIKIDLTKIDQSRKFVGKNGAKYIDLTTFIDTDKESQYGDHGFISQSVTKEEKEAGLQTPILGNTKVFWGIPKGQQQAPQQQAPQQAQGQAPQQQQAPESDPFADDSFDDDVPF